MKCLIDGCDGVGKIRGLCPICYQAATVRVKRGEITWAVLENMRLANKPQHKGRGDGAFTKALRQQQELNRQPSDKAMNEEIERLTNKKMNPISKEGTYNGD